MRLELASGFFAQLIRGFHVGMASAFVDRGLNHFAVEFDPVTGGVADGCVPQPGFLTEVRTRRSRSQILVVHVGVIAEP